MNERRCRWLGIAGAIALACSAPAPGQTAAGVPDNSRGLGGVRASVGVPAGVGARDAADPLAGIRPSALQSIVKDALPLGGVKSQPARPIKGLVSPRFPQNTRAGWIPTWPRIPDLPQVKSKAPDTNRIVSRAEEERREAEKTPVLRPTRDTRAAQEQAERIRRVRETVDSGDTREIRRIASEEAARHVEIDRFVERAGIGYSRGPGQVGGDCGDGRAIDPGAGQAPDERLLSPAAAEQMDPREKADRALAAGDLANAVNEYLVQVTEHPEDSDSARCLAVVLLLADRPEHAGKAILEAYRADPSLTDRAFDPSNLPADVSVRSLATRVARKAGAQGSPGAWLLAAALAQADGRLDVAARFVERGRAAGLDAPIADAFVTSLAREVSNGRAGS